MVFANSDPDANSGPDWMPVFMANLTFGQIITFLIAVAALVMLSKKIKPFIDGLRNFLDDWAGTEARPGVSKRPGVMERLGNIEQRLDTADIKLTETNKQLKPNGGNSVADKVTQIREAIIPSQRSDLKGASSEDSS